MMGVEPEWLRNSLFKLELDLEHVLAGGEAGAVAHPEDVRVDRESLLAESRVQNDVRGLAADTRQCLQFFACMGNLALMVPNQRFGEGDDVLRLGVEQADGFDRIAKPFLAECDHLLRRFHMLEQRPRRDVDAGVGSLRRQHYGHEQGVGIFELEFCRGGGVFLREPAEEFEDLLSSHSASMTSRME